MSNEERLNVFRNKFWKPVQETLDYLTTKSPDEVKAWLLTETYSSTYTQVYMCCTAPAIVPPPCESEIPAKFSNGELTYECLRIYMTKRFQKVSLGIESKNTQEKAFVCFLQAHKAFETYRRIIERNFHYIQYQWIDVVNNRSLSFRKKYFRSRNYLFPYGCSWLSNPVFLVY